MIADLIDAYGLGQLIFVFLAGAMLTVPCVQGYIEMCETERAVLHHPRHEYLSFEARVVIGLVSFFIWPLFAIFITVKVMWWMFRGFPEFISGLRTFFATGLSDIRQYFFPRKADVPKAKVVKR